MQIRYGNGLHIGKSMLGLRGGRFITIVDGLANVPLEVFEELKRGRHPVEPWPPATPQADPNAGGQGASAPALCTALTKSGQPCKGKAMANGLCNVHGGSNEPPADPPAGDDPPTEPVTETGDGETETPPADPSAPPSDPARRKPRLVGQEEEQPNGETR